MCEMGNLWCCTAPRDAVLRIFMAIGLSIGVAGTLMGMAFGFGLLYFRAGVLRGVDSDVPSLRNTMVKLCCPKATADAYKADALSFAQARKQVNLYTTTLCAAPEWHPAPPFPLHPIAAQRVYPSPPLLMLPTGCYMYCP